MNERKEAEEDHEDDGDYEGESSPARRGVKGKKGKGNGKVGRPKEVKVTPPPPAAAAPTTTAVPPMNVVFGEEVIKDTQHVCSTLSSHPSSTSTSHSHRFSLFPFPSARLSPSPASSSFDPSSASVEAGIKRFRD